MAYKLKTDFYKIPVMGDGDLLTQEQELIQMNMIDHLLCAANFGCTHAIIEEGTYTADFGSSSESDETPYTLTISPSINGYSLLGILNGRVFMSHDTISVQNLSTGNRYYVYAEATEGLNTDASSFNVVAYTSRQLDSNLRLVLCTISISGTISTDVDSKTYAKNLMAHTMDSTNPHGANVTQDNLAVVESLTVGGVAVHGIEITSAVTAGNGSAVDVEFSSAPSFITVYPATLDAGEIAWTIEGNVAHIYNAGSSGVALRIKADM